MTTPICPCCTTPLVPRVFSGYYDSFTCWTCACTDTDTLIPGSTVLAGAYGGATTGDLIVTGKQIGRAHV